MNLVSFLIFCWMAALRTKLSHAEPFFGLLTFPTDENYNISVTTYLTTVKIYNIIELTRQCGSPALQSKNRMIQVSIGACYSFFNSLDTNVGTWSGPYAQLSRMSLDVLKDGKCLMSSFIDNLNNFNTFTSQLWGILPYFEKYVNQDLGANITLTFRSIESDMNKLYKTVNQITDESTRAYNDPNTDINLFQLSPVMKNYTGNLLGILQDFLQLWTNAESQMQVLVSTIFTNQNIYERVGSLINSQLQIYNNSIDYFVYIAEQLKSGSAGPSLTSIQSMVDIYSRGFSRVLNALYSDNIVKKNWTERQSQIFNKSIVQIQQQLNATSASLSDSNYLSNYAVASNYQIVYQSIVGDFYDQIRSVVAAINARLSDASQCAQTFSWNLFSHILSFSYRYYSCPLPRIIRLFSLYPQITSTVNNFQNNFVNTLYFNGFTCLFGSYTGGSVRRRLAVSSCLDSMVKNLQTISDNFKKDSDSSNSKYEQDFGLIQSICSLCFNQTRSDSLINLALLNNTFNACIS